MVRAFYSFVVMAISLGLGMVSICQSSPKVINHSEKHKKLLLEVWNERVLQNKGVHEWNSQYDAKFVFQEWITLLEIAKNKSKQERYKLGMEFEKYVVEGNIQSLTQIGTTVPLPGSVEGDFDMTLLGCISLIYLYEKDYLLLTDTTYVHLIKNVIKLWGQNPKRTFDVLLIEFQETENHLLMTESSRYLTNQLIWKNPRGLPDIRSIRDSLALAGVKLNNSIGGLRTILLKQMHVIMKKGFFEFNAKVYQRFTLHALDNLYSFSLDTTLKKAAESVLDYSSVKFAFQSYSSMRRGPYRRNAEKYKDKDIWASDPACSFYGAQSGAFPWSSKGSIKNSWVLYRSHSSIGLFSTLLDYRIPKVILNFMQKKSGSYLAKMETKYEIDGGLETSPEIYLSHPNFLISAGGRYKFYKGANFPVPAQDFLTEETPWVYDVIARSSSVFVNTLKSNGTEKIPDFLNYGGSHWKNDNLAVYKNFVYSYCSKDDYNSADWPHVIPENWEIKDQINFTRGRLDYKIFQVDGIYVVMTRLHQKGSWWKRKFQKYTRGSVEIIDTSWVNGIKDLKIQKSSLELKNANDYQYLLNTGEIVKLNPYYPVKENGIEWIRSIEKNSTPELKWEEEIFPLLSVEELSPKNLFPVKNIVFADGKGNLRVENPGLNSALVIDFRAWWNPKRILISSIPNH